MREISCIIGSVAALCLGAMANGGSVTIDALGGPVQLHSTTVGPGVFGSDSPVLTNSALTNIHNSLNGDGVKTNGRVTFVLLDTDAGLAFVTLIDKNPNNAGSGDPDSSIGMTTTATSLNQDFVNDAGSDITTIVDPGFGLQTATGEFAWDSGSEGDGFAWANLQVGDTATFNFTRQFGELPSSPGLNDISTFQFVSFNGESWEVVSVGDWTENDQFAFSYAVVPLPTAIGLGLAGLGVLALRRRRLS